jgi:hypothetical protein
MSAPYRIAGFEFTADEALKNVGEKVTTIEHRSYQNEHEILQKWFSDNTRNKAWNGPLVRLAGLAIYGWMPTILRAEGRKSVERNVNFDEIANRLNNDGITESDFTFLNGSVVGTSKFLHFWKPENFAIWDSNIRSALKLSAYGNALEQFSDYLVDIRRYANEKNLTLREVEFALFRHGGGDYVMIENGKNFRKLP